MSRGSVRGVHAFLSATGYAVNASGPPGSLRGGPYVSPVCARPRESTRRDAPLPGCRARTYVRVGSTRPCTVTHVSGTVHPCNMNDLDRQSAHRIIGARRPAPRKGSLPPTAPDAAPPCPSHTRAARGCTPPPGHGAHPGPDHPRPGNPSTGVPTPTGVIRTQHHVPRNGPRRGLAADTTSRSRFRPRGPVTGDDVPPLSEHPSAPPQHRRRHASLVLPPRPSSCVRTEPAGSHSCTAHRRAPAGGRGLAPPGSEVRGTSAATAVPAGLRPGREDGGPDLRRASHVAAARGLPGPGGDRSHRSPVLREDHPRTGVPYERDLRLPARGTGVRRGEGNGRGRQFAPAAGQARAARCPAAEETGTDVDIRHQEYGLGAAPGRSASGGPGRWRRAAPDGAARCNAESAPYEDRFRVPAEHPGRAAATSQWRSSAPRFEGPTTLTG
ncbi:hypothetical protein EES45_01385 [Streptomyces sp. ADI97-07]|nr:hypothetical protein EES45_01385 [Streptomyces sp. ADI97-07]